MKKFLKQFNLSPMMNLRFESFIFNLADKLVVGYGGGIWKTKEIDGRSILLLPVTGYVTLNNENSGTMVITDHITASAAFTYLAINWFWNNVTDNISDDSNEKFNEVFYALRDSVFSGKPSVKFDVNAFFTFTD